MTFPSIYILKAVLYVRQNIHKFESHDQPYNTRHCGLPLIQHRTALFQKSPNYNFVKLYNKLPIGISQITNYNKFKSKVKSLLLQAAYYTQQEYLDDRL